MAILRTLGLAILCFMVSLAVSADPAFSKPKHGKWEKQKQEYDDEYDGKRNGKSHHKKHKKAHHSHDQYDCDYLPPGLAKNGKMPPGLARQGKTPPGWAKKCQPVYRADDRSNRDPGYHMESDRYPCRNTAGVLSGMGSDKNKSIAGTTAAGAVVGGSVGSATGDTAMGAILGGVVGGILGAKAGSNKDRERTSQRQRTASRGDC
jgi:hypothetical protein